MIFNLIWYWLQRWTPTQKFNISFLYTIKWQGRIFQDGCDIVNIRGIWKFFLWLWHFFAYYYYLLSYISLYHLSTNNTEEDYQPNLNCLTMFYVVVASFTLKNIQFTTVQAFRDLLQIPTEQVSRKFGYNLFYNLYTLVIITLMSIFISVKESIFLYLYNIIPLLFFFNLILWTFTHIALYCKTKIADQTNWTQSTFFEIWNKFCKIVPILITIQTTEEKQYLVIWAYCTIELVATEVKTLKFKTF